MIKIATDELSAELEIKEVLLRDIEYLTTVNGEFNGVVTAPDTKIYYFGKLKVNIPSDVNYAYILDIITRYNAVASSSGKSILTPSGADVEVMRNKKNSNVSFSELVDRVLMKQMIKETVVDPKYKNVTMRLFRKMIDQLELRDNDIVFGESASNNSAELMTFSNFYLSPEKRSEYLLNGFYKTLWNFKTFRGKGTYDTYKSIGIVDFLADFNIIYTNVKNLRDKTTVGGNIYRSIEQKIQFGGRRKFLRFSTFRM
jgi:hypothetical protein